jgi:hypothetical protein
VPAWARFITRPPGVGDHNEPLREGSESGPAASLYAYFMVMAFTGYIGFILTHSVNSSRLDVTFWQALAEMGAAAALALIWWVQDLANGAIVADLRRDLKYNLGFNSHEASISVFTVLTGAGILVVAEMLGYNRNPWQTIGPLLFFKWSWGVWADKRHMLAVKAAAAAELKSGGQWVKP